MADSLVINEWLAIPKSEFRWSYARSSGPGGQNVNKLNTKAVLRWSVAATTALPAPVRDRLVAAHANRLNERGELVIASDRHREQGRNVGDCLDRLRALVLAVAKPPKRRVPTRKPRGANEARLKTKRRRSETKSRRRRPIDPD